MAFSPRTILMRHMINCGCCVGVWIVCGHSVAHLTLVLPKW